MEIGMEVFSTLEKPELEFFGVAVEADASGHPFVNIAELVASTYHYLVVIELPHVKCYEGEVEWTVNEDGEVTIEGQIDGGEIFGDVTSGLKRRRVQLCPTKYWGVTFYLPGPVEWWTTSVYFTSSTVMELMVRKDIPLPELATTPYPLGVGLPRGMDLLEMIARGDTSTITNIPPITIPPLASCFVMATNSDVASPLGVGSPTGMDLFEMIAMADTSTITTIPPVATNSNVASSLGVGPRTLLELVATADIPSMPYTYTTTNSNVASSSGVNLPRASDIYEMMEMGVASDVDEMIGGWLM